MTSTPDAPEAAAKSLRTRLLRTLLLRNGCSHAAGWCFAWGIAALALRMFLGARTAWVLWGAAGLVPVLLAAAWRARKQLPSRTAMLAMVDRLGRCGGLVMAGGETDLGPWRRRIRPPAVPEVRWPWRKGAGLLAASAALVVAACLIPQRYIARPDTPRLDVAGQVGELAEQVDALAEQDLLSERESEQLRQELEQIAAEARGDDPARTLEALDHLRQKLAAAAAEGVEKALRSAHEAAAARAMAEGLAGDAGRLEPNALAEGLKHLADQLDRAKQASDQLADELAKAGSGAGDPNQLDPNQLQQLAEALGECNSATIERLAELAEAGLLDAEALQRAIEAAGAMDPESLAELIDQLGDGEGEMSLEDLAAEWARLCRGEGGTQGPDGDGLPGRGGMSRGRGDAALTWKDPSNDEGVTFKEKVLPPGQVADLKQSRLAGLGAGAPEVKPGEGTTSGALCGEAAGGGSTHRRTILPRHRRAVREYFDRPAPSPPPKEPNP